MSTTPFVKFKQDLGDDKVALNTAGYGITESGIWVPIKVTDEGVQEVRQSGTNTVLLSGFYDMDVHWTAWHNYYWGKEGTMGGNGNVPLDVRGYREIAVRITSDLKSQGVEQTIKYAVYAYTDLISWQESSHAVDILVPLTELPYGATIYLTADQYPKLADPHLGILVHTQRTIFQEHDEGGTTVEIIGRV